ncbi:3'-5' exonuclease [Gimesia algae]|uniref:DNA 3'-5' helicase n=1 Tax=Gimesia algae TaxID=2527971 RepID=A0A517VB03_9PLAN|nr:3'-5' exonuclease [Gimesia algae]QDT90168.1 Putative ATP-dependent DNA helicase YjcD [Gimesia algae]
MQFRIAHTFTDSLTKLTGEEQKSVKMTAFDLQMDPSGPGLQFHRIDGAKDKHFWSVRVNRDIRLIIHKTEASFLLCYVDHHDDAYDWAERRKLEIHPKTGAAQMVEIRETVKEITVPRYVESVEPSNSPKLFESLDESELLKYGIPVDWIDDVHNATEDSLFELIEHLPEEAAEVLLELATGGKPQLVQTTSGAVNPFDHPDAQRRFHVVTNQEELRLALNYPWEKWLVFLHPEQRKLVQKQYNGPVKVSGSAGTGKTVVALHRAAYLAEKNPQARLLVTTFSEALAEALKNKLRYLIGNSPKLFERVEVHSIDQTGYRLYSANIGNPDLIDKSDLSKMLQEASEFEGTHRFSQQFIWSEWNDIVDAWQLDSWEMYRDVSRLGRKTRLGEKQRSQLWTIFERVRNKLTEQNLLTKASMFSEITKYLQQEHKCPYDYAIVDESQDFGIPEMKFLSAMGSSHPDSLFFAGDLGQRIFQLPFSWMSLGIDIRGRSHTLHINYRTSHQIRGQADRLLPVELSDVDGNTENRKGTVSAFSGPNPTIRIFDSEDLEIDGVVQWLRDRIAEGVQAEEIGLIVRSENEINRASKVIESLGLKAVILGDSIETNPDSVSVLTMHLAKGLEFRVVAVMACDDEVVPLQSRLESITDESDLEEVYNTERHLLYVACTRARDQLMVSGVDPASEFLDDLKEDN